MGARWRGSLYVAAATALLLILIVAPGAWATPGQNRVIQTIPTRTPTAEPVTPTDEPPTAEPQPSTPDPAATATATLAPGQTPVATATTAAPAAARSPLGLTLVANRQQVWTGATVTFTMTVTNAGATPLQQITVEDVLAAGLEPGEVLSGGATWDGRTLRLTAPSLAAGARLQVVYTARVTATAPGAAIATRATATAAGGASATATLTLGLPPTELPTTGGVAP